MQDEEVVRRMENHVLQQLNFASDVELAPSPHIRTREEMEEAALLLEMEKSCRTEIVRTEEDFVYLPTLVTGLRKSKELKINLKTLQMCKITDPSKFYDPSNLQLSMKLLNNHLDYLKSVDPHKKFNYVCNILPYSACKVVRDYIFNPPDLYPTEMLKIALQERTFMKELKKPDHGVTVQQIEDHRPSAVLRRVRDEIKLPDQDLLPFFRQFLPRSMQDTINKLPPFVPLNKLASIGDIFYALENDLKPLDFSRIDSSELAVRNTRKAFKKIHQDVSQQIQHIMSTTQSRLNDCSSNLMASDLKQNLMKTLHNGVGFEDVLRASVPDANIQSSRPEQSSTSPEQDGDTHESTSEQEGTSASTPEQEGTPASTPEQEGTPASTPEQEGTPASTSEQEGTPASTSEQEGTPASTPEQEGTPASTPEQKGTPASTPKQEGTPASTPEQEGTPASTPKQEGTPASTSEKEGDIPESTPEQEGYTPESTPVQKSKTGSWSAQKISQAVPSSVQGAIAKHRTEKPETKYAKSEPKTKPDQKPGKQTGRNYPTGRK